MRLPALILGGLLSIAATVPPPPPVLQPYIKDGRFDPGNYGWMRGQFDDASASDKAVAASVRAWTDACFAAGEAETRSELRTMGIPDPKLEQMGFRNSLCAQVAHMPYAIDRRSFARFQQAVATARPIAETYLMAVGIATDIGGPRGPALQDRLLARPLSEQMLRKGLSWGDGELKNAPPLSPDVKAIVIARIGAALAERDQANTEWLKAIVAKQGWPKISEVGEPASGQAWLLVQHADADPAFQLQALRLMEPLLAKGEVTKPNYAYLYDRVMLKIVGKQRYATQATCEAGKLVPQPLEDEAAVPRLRAEAQLEPLETYMDQLRAVAGGCPEEPPAAAR